MVPAKVAIALLAARRPIAGTFADRGQARGESGAGHADNGPGKHYQYETEHSQGWYRRGRQQGQSRERPEAGQPHREPYSEDEPGPVLPRYATCQYEQSDADSRR